MKRIKSILSFNILIILVISLITPSVNTQVEALTFTPAELPTAIVGEPYSVNIYAHGGTPPYTFWIEEGQLPGYVSMAVFETYVTIAGTIIQPGTWSFRIRAEDSNLDPVWGRKWYTISASVAMPEDPSPPEPSPPEPAPFDFYMDVTPTRREVEVTSTTSGTAEFRVTLILTRGLPEDVTLSSLPEIRGATYHMRTSFYPYGIARDFPFTTTFVVSVLPGSEGGVYTVPIMAVGGGVTREATVTVAVVTGIAAGDLRIDHAEPVQAIYDISSAPYYESMLVNGKNTLFRVTYTSTFGIPVDTQILLYLWPTGTEGEAGGLQSWDGGSALEWRDYGWQIGPYGWWDPGWYYLMDITAQPGTHEVLLPDPNILDDYTSPSSFGGRPLTHVSAPRPLNRAAWGLDVEFYIIIDPADEVFETDEEAHPGELYPAPNYWINNEWGIRPHYPDWGGGDLGPRHELRPELTVSDNRYWLTPTRPVRILYLLCYWSWEEDTMFPTTASISNWHALRDDTAHDSSEFILGTFPIAEDKLMYDVNDAMLLAHGFWGQVGSEGEWNDLWCITRTSILADSFNELSNVGWNSGYDRTVALVRSDWLGDYWYCSELDLQTAIGVAWPEVTSGACFVELPSGGGSSANIAAHELAHTYGIPELYNHGCTLHANEGYWINQRESISGRHSFMDHGGCGPFWIDGWEYSHLHLNLYSENDPELIGIRGLLFKNNTILLDPFYRLPDGFPDLEPGAEGDYSVVFLDATGKELTRVNFDVAFSISAETVTTIDVDVVPIAFRLVWIEGTREIQIMGPNDQVLASRTVSSNPPTVQIIYPNGGETFSTLNEYVITWGAEDPDEDPMTFTALFSSDGGDSWNPIATDVSEKQVQFPTKLLMPGEEYLIKVIASDGVNTGEDTSDSTFTVTAAPTEATPEAGTPTIGPPTPAPPLPLEMIGLIIAIIIAAIVIVVLVRRKGTKPKRPKPKKSKR